MIQKSTTKILRVFGKKPRASKTSKRFFFSGFNFFAHRSTAETAGFVHLYWDKVPYPHIAVIICDKDDDTVNVSEKWVEANLDELLDKFTTVKDCIQVPREFLKKGLKDSKYRIESKAFKGSTLVILGLSMSEGIFVYVDADAPTKTVKNRKNVDSDKVLIEYNKRLSKIEGAY